MRVNSPNSILFHDQRKKTKSLKTRTFVDNCEFKNHYQENDQIELNIQNKLFIVTGSKFRQFFCFTLIGMK